MKRKLFGIVCFVAALCLCFGCGTKNDDKTILKVGTPMMTFAQTLEPTDNYNSWALMEYGLAETLTKYSKDMHTQGNLVTRWQHTGDLLTWQFFLRNDVKFSNGKKLTALDAKKSLERVFEKSARAKSFFEYEKISAEKNILTIKLKKPLRNLYALLANPLFVIIDTDSERERDFQKLGPVTTAPYICESFTPEKCVVVKNKNYWRGDVPFEKIIFTKMDDATTRAMALQSGEIDLATDIAANDLGNFRNKKEFVVNEIPSLRVVMVQLNQSSQHLLKEKFLREALRSALDIKTYNDVVLKKAFVTAKAALSPSFDLYKFDELHALDYNPARAKKILEENGWKDTDNDGILEKDGKKLSLKFLIYTGRSELPIYAQAMQADAKKVGIDIHIEMVDYGVLNKLVRAGDYDLSILSITAETSSAFFDEQWHSPNCSNYENLEVNQKLDELRETHEIQARINLIDEIQQNLLDDTASIFLGHPNVNNVHQSNVHGVEIFPVDYYLITEKILKK